MIEVAASVVWVIAAAAMSVPVTVGEIVGLVMGGIVGEVVGRTVDGAVGDAVGEVGTSFCADTGPGTILVARCGGIGVRSETFELSVVRCFVGAASAASAASAVGIGAVVVLPITSGVIGLVHGVVFVGRIVFERHIVLVRYVVFVDAYVGGLEQTVEQGKRVA